LAPKIERRDFSDSESSVAMIVDFDSFSYGLLLAMIKSALSFPGLNFSFDTFQQYNVINKGRAAIGASQ